MANDDHEQAEDAAADPPNEEGAAPAASGEPLEPSLLLEDPPRVPVRRPLARRLGRYVAAVGLLLVLTGVAAGVQMLGLL